MDINSLNVGMSGASVSGVGLSVTDQRVFQTKNHDAPDNNSLKLSDAYIRQ